MMTTDFRGCARRCGCKPMFRGPYNQHEGLWGFGPNVSPAFKGVLLSAHEWVQEIDKVVNLLVVEPGIDGVNVLSFRPSKRNR